MGNDLSSTSFRTLDSCPVCNSVAENDSVTLLDYPLTELFFDGNPDSVTTVTQAIAACDNCGHVFLRRQLDPSQLYGTTYQTRSSKSAAAQSALARLLGFFVDRLDLDDFDMCVDIGANDGTFLELLKSSGFRGSRIGVDPSNDLWPEGVEGYTDFAENVDLPAITQRSGRKFIVASHVIEHVAKPVEFLGHLASAMKPTDVLLMQFPALEPMLTEFRFDQVHHQHYHYFGSGSFVRALTMSGLRLISAGIDWQHYGSATCLVMPDGRGPSGSQSDHWTSISRSLFPGTPSVGRLVADHYARFEGLQAVINESLRTRRYVALGAGLMAPIVFYHLPGSWDSCTAILDDDAAKWGRRYCGTPASIEPVPKTLEGQVVLISGAVSRSAGRALVERAMTIGAGNVVVPVVNL